MSKSWAACVAVLTFVPVVAIAQPPEKPKPGPEHKALEYFVGAWSTEGENQKSPFSPGGKFTESVTCQWFEGGFHVMCKGTGSGSMGQISSVSFLGYDPEQKAYTYRAINSRGDAPEAKGTKQGSTWTWTFSPTMKGQTFNGRFTLDELSPTSYSFKEEFELEGKWTVVSQGKSTKQAGGKKPSEE